MSVSNLPISVPLSWAQDDVESRCGFRGGQFTQVNNLLSFLIGAALTVAFYSVLIPLHDSQFARVFRERGPTQHCTTLLTFWSLAILWLKWRKLALQRRSLAFVVVPESPDFVLSSGTVEQVFERVYATVDDPRRFLLFNRIVIALGNLRNLGRVSDVDEIFRSQGDQEASSLETSYSVVQGFVWAIPVLGFIGTVLGLSDAIGGFGSVLESAGEISEITQALKGVTAGLYTAFDTTLVALVAALVIQLLLTFLKKSEEEFLDSCADYCSRHVVGRLRVMPFERGQV